MSRSIPRVTGCQCRQPHVYQGSSCWAYHQRSWTNNRAGGSNYSSCTWKEEYQWPSSHSPTHSITLFTTSSLTRRGENLVHFSTLTSMTTFVYWPMLPRRRTNPMQARLWRGATITAISTYSPPLDGR